MLLPFRGMKFLEGISQPHALAVAGRVVSPSLVFMPRRGNHRRIAIGRWPTIRRCGGGHFHPGRKIPRDSIQYA